MRDHSEIQEARLDYLLQALLADSNEYGNLRVKKEEKRRLLRSLMNLRMPRPMPEEFWKIQDAFLKEEVCQKGIQDVKEIPTVARKYGSGCKFADRMALWQGDITRLKADAIVNAANSQMLGCFVPCHGCIDNAIHSAAGLQLREECSRLMKAQGYEEPVGRAKITKAYNLPCRYVLHTVGPIIQGPLTHRDCEALRSCYASCMALGEEKGIKTLAFCCISTGEFHFPNEAAARIAVETVQNCLDHSSIDTVVFNVFKEQDLYIYEKLFSR